MNWFFLKSSLRSLTKNKGYSFINIGGLTLGIVVIMLIGMWIHDELSYNKYHDNYQSIVKVMRLNKSDNGEIFTGSWLTTGTGTLLKSEYSNYFKKVAMVPRIENRVIEAGEKRLSENGYFMQAEGTEIFSLKMKFGSRDGLTDMNSILLSASLAKKLFGDINPVNQDVKMDAKWNLKVTGVYEDLPSNSEFNEASYFAPLDRYLAGRSNLNVWNNYNMTIYAQLNPNADPGKLSSIIEDAILPHINNKCKLFLHPMNRWHLFSRFENGKNAMSEQLKFVLIYGIIGFFVLLLACINFMNLTTARSDKYTKEIGIRKTLGAARYLMMRKFLSESLLLVLLSFILSFCLIILVLPWFNQLAGKELNVLWGNLWFWFSCLTFILITALLSGSYPAFYLSSFKPAKALKGNKQARNQTAKPRKFLVVFQFAISIILIIGTLTVNRQIQHAKNRPVGYTRKGLITLRPRSPEYSKKFHVLKNELKKNNAVYEVAAGNYPVTNNRGSNPFFEWKGKPSGVDPSFNTIKVSNEYGKTVGWELLSGRDFSKELKSDLSGVVINESAQKLMQLNNPVGETLKWSPPHFKEPRFYTILGVVKDMVKSSPYESTAPSIIFLSEKKLTWLFIRINPAVSAGKALSKIEKTFNKIIPSAPFDYQFADDEYNIKFREEEQVANLASVFAVLAIIISCLGLFGLATFLAERRIKEIGIRKVNGAKISEILSMLNKDFIKWVAIAFVVACPIAYYAMNKWLENFAYKTTLSWWIFALAGVLALGIALLTVSWQSWRAATRNPVEALRYE
jgi:putative ABC transport system permease protein